jgi:hypothetical protein
MVIDHFLRANRAVNIPDTTEWQVRLLAASLGRLYYAWPCSAARYLWLMNPLSNPGSKVEEAMGDPIVQGKVHVIEETKTFGQSGFRKRVVVIEQDKGRFTNYIPIEFTHEACDSLDDLSPGDEVEIPYRLNGRKWQRDAQSEVKYFLNAQGLSFRVIGGTDGRAPEGRDSQSGPPSAPEFNPPPPGDDDVPF